MPAEKRRAWVAVASVVVVALLIAPHRSLSTDAYLSLVCGREVVQHGLPHVDSLTAVSAGKPWVDQQWLGQALIYAAYRAGGLQLALALHVLFAGAAAAICAWYAERRGASAAAVFVAGLAAFAVEGAFLTLRPQMFSLVAFAALLALLGDDLAAPSRKVFLVWPILALWANLHGVMVVGVALVGLRALFDVAGGLRSRTPRQVGRGALLGAVAAVTPFCSPYARELPGYFARIGHLQDASRQLPIVEWLRPTLKNDWAFYLILVVFVVPLVVVWIRRKVGPGLFQAIVLGVTGVASLRAGRHMIWFGLALAAYGPVLFDGINVVREGPVIHRVARLVARVGPIVVVAALARLALTSEARLERYRPAAALAPLRDALAREPPSARVVTSDTLSDWLLWHAPELAGRVEFDVRFELYDDEQARELDTFLFAGTGYRELYPDAPIALVSKESHPALAKGLREAPGAVVLWEDEDAVLLRR